MGHDESKLERIKSADEPAPWHSRSIGSLEEEFGSGRDGLSGARVEEALAEFGANELREAESPGPLSLLVKQLASPLIIMLLGAAAISVLAGHGIDAIVILAVVALNTVIGMSQEWRAEKALEALRKLSAPHARVLRDGQPATIDAADVVPGDVVLLETGDRVAADLRLIESSELALDESALTGESEP
ncbi:MAG TPA: HAD-IC family P-type ATPase, partial [Coriobacteriia bacterium]|nr:HAD-IC family P-type ATPase [Coriobacteriia bacterium]